MSKRSELLKKRYAEDPEYREGVLAGKRARHAICKTDINARRRLRYATDPEYRQRFLDRDPIKVREKELKRKYGISLQDYDAMLAQQHAACAICRRTFDGTPCVDHCHATRVVRGLLCSPCNQGLGCFDDDIDRMQAAADYLRRPPSDIVVRPRRDRAARATTGTSSVPPSPGGGGSARPSPTVEPGWGETRSTGTARGAHPTPLAASREGARQLATLPFQGRVKQGRVSVSYPAARGHA
jgi:hypothetical protein